ncbi:hypothetical protein LAZ67_5003578 [Cordylochernes scorpioides]|uniref:Uncharacterized protein n=1 Tax=Cordylochernes scorpioides TaxID=51811 RepID=A0ABY6KHM7_9ARAC|nr:hypothetical protein LAZ67_5003578 [Cordylochernes scorpioides]
MAAASQGLENAGNLVAKLRAKTREVKETVFDISKKTMVLSRLHHRMAWELSSSRCMKQRVAPIGLCITDVTKTEIVESILQAKEEEEETDQVDEEVDPDCPHSRIQKRSWRAFKLCDCFFNVRMSPSLFIGISGWPYQELNSRHPVLPVYTLHHFEAVG